MRYIRKQKGRERSERERVQKDMKVEGQFCGQPHLPAVIEKALVLRPFRSPSNGRSRYEDQSKDRRREKKRKRKEKSGLAVWRLNGSAKLTMIYEVGVPNTPFY